MNEESASVMNLNKIGNTQKGVSIAVTEILKDFNHQSFIKSLIDVPCGNGEFSDYIKGQFEQVQITGVDFFAKPQTSSLTFHQLRAQEYFRTAQPKNIDAITCISGVMCFDGIEELFSQFNQSLRENGLLVVTNDNVLTFRDRLSFMLYGRLRRFKLIYSTHEGNWNCIFPQGLLMLLERNGFKVFKIKYTSIYNEDYLLMPLALLLYPFFFLYLVLQKSHLTLKQRLQLFPLKALIARHYVIAATKINRE